jgi:NTP pyrophosphatase (non-canonical NTP hydrolase)
MNLDEYQKQALETDQIPHLDDIKYDPEKLVPLLGLAGETGELLSEYKKYLRDGDAHVLFKDRIAEELGDLLWYISNVAWKFELSLDNIAQSNLSKVRDRWGGKSSSLKVQPYVDDVKFGDGLTDNYPEDDGYRFHDVFHLAYVAILGWSPVIRKLLGRKRRSCEDYDEIQDGGRAIVIDEGIVALVFAYAANHGNLASTDWVDYHLLKTIKSMTEHLEVSERTTGDWEKAIVEGYKVWREVVKHDGGRMLIDLDKREIQFIGI